MTEDEMVGWHHRLNGHEFEQAPGVGDGLGSLVCCSPWDRKESDTTEQPSVDYSHLWNKNIYMGSWPSSKVCCEVKWNDGL